MSVRGVIMVGVLAVALIAGFGANAARKYHQDSPSVWLDPHANNELLASRLNITSVAKTPRTKTAAKGTKRALARFGVAWEQ